MQVPAEGQPREARKAGLAIHGTVVSFLNPVTNVLNCMGNGLCGTCRVLVKKGMENLGPKSGVEAPPGGARPPW
ncbi:MAG: hypothetical protein U0797_04225 [Gemmataceae bacterium]